MNINQMKDQHKKIVGEMRSITASPAGDGGDLSEDQEMRFGNLKIDLDKLEKRIERQILLDEAARRTQGISLTGDHKLDNEMRGFSLMRALQHQLGAKVDAGRELEISSELARLEGRSADGFFMPYSVFEKRAADVMTTGLPSTGPGSNLIGTDHLGGQFIDLLREANPLTGLGTRCLTGLTGNVEVTKLKRSTGVGWFGENSAIPETDAAFDKITLGPRHVGAWCQYSRNMLLQSSPDIENVLRSDLAQVLGLEVARATISGTGTGAEPRGILESGILEIAKPSMSSNDMDYVPLLASELFLQNVQGISFLVNASYKSVVDQILSSDGIPVGAATFFRGYPHKFTSLVPADNVMIGGDFSDIFQGFWSAVEVMINPYMESAYKKGNVALRIILTMDVAVRHSESFATFEA